MYKLLGVVVETLITGLKELTPCREQGLSCMMFFVCVYRWHNYCRISVVFGSTNGDARRGSSQGIAHLHGLAIVHGDLKPSNILLDDKNHPRIADWGLSRLSLGITHPANLATHGGFTQGFAAPEVTAGKRSSFASDMYAGRVVRWDTPCLFSWALLCWQVLVRLHLGRCCECLHGQRRCGDDPGVPFRSK